jgi:hypothetical protein
MPTNRIATLTTFTMCAFVALSVPAAELPAPPVTNWSVAPYWSPGAGHPHTAKPGAGTREASAAASAGSLPFTAVAPCRLYDSRTNLPFTGDSTYNTNGQTELFDFYSTSPPPYAATVNPNGCTLPPAGAAGAWSLKFTYRTSSATQGVLTAFPGDLSSPPAIGTILGSNDRFTSGMAIVPAGADPHSMIKVYAQYAANAIVIDYNGYFAPLLPYLGVAPSPGGTDLFTIQNTGGGRAMHAITSSDTALWAESGTGSGVDGRSNSGAGVYGFSDTNDAVEGDANAAGKSGVYGSNSVAGGYGVYGKNWFNSNYGYLGGIYGVYGNGSATGVMGESSAGKGVHGKSTGFDGVWGESAGSGNSGVYGFNSDSGGYGVTGRNSSNSNYGYLGGSYAVYGSTSSSQAAVVGQNSDTSSSSAGVVGTSASSDVGAAGVVGETSQSTGNGGILHNSAAVAWVYMATTVSGHVYSMWTTRDAYIGSNIYNSSESSVAPHPEDPSKEIVYTSVEAPTADVYFRGTTRLENGVARIEVPDHFRLTAREDSYQATVTALASHADLWVERQDESGIFVRGEGNVAFNYVVWAERDIYRDLEAVRDNVHFTPQALGKGEALRNLPERVRAVLVKNGTLNCDGTYNQQTVSRLGWTIPELRDTSPR